MRRIALTLAGAVLVGGSLAGCSHGALASQLTPAAPATTESSVAPAVNGSPENGSSMQDIQDDLNSAAAATSNASGDVSDADTSAATSDSP
ncbi:MAG TPA: hypothetical protein VIJ11_05655 [Galbitalea sp.]